MQTTQPCAAVCILVNEDGQVLAVTRGNKPLDLGLPGGKVEPGETPVQGCCRELREETGLIARPEDCTFLYKQYVEEYLVYTYFVSYWQGIQVKKTHEGEVLWVDPGRLCTEMCTFGKYNERAIEAMKVHQATGAESAF